jgi:hypothetical protein
LPAGDPPQMPQDEPAYATAMARHVDPERLHIARRMGLSARLVADARLSQDSAERWIALWEAEARSRYLDAQTAAWWDGAWEWIAGQRGR